MDREYAIEVAKKYAEQVVNSFPVKNVILYGSFAKDTASEYSDIDIAVLVDFLTEDYLETAAKLYKLRRDIELRIEPKILIDDGSDKSGFIEEVKSTGYSVYPI